jgi:ATP-dependent DNA helicase DinG
MTEPAASTNSNQAEANSNGNAKKGPMTKRNLLFLDLETTGLNVGQHEITEVGALLVSQPDFKVIGTYQTKVMPTHLETATEEALKIGHFDLKTWEQEAKSLEVAMKELAEFGRDAMLSGFNLTFDWAYLQVAFNQVGIEDPFYYHRFDVMSAAYGIMFGHKDFSKYSLSECCRFFGVTNRNAHTAFADAEATYEVFLGLMHYRDQNLKAAATEEELPQD